MKCLSWLSVISNMCFPRDYVIEILEPIYFTLFVCSVYLYAIARVCYLNILTMYILRKNYQGLMSLLHGFQKERDRERQRETERESERESERENENERERGRHIDRSMYLLFSIYMYLLFSAEEKLNRVAGFSHQALPTTLNFTKQGII